MERLYTSPTRHAEPFGMTQKASRLHRPITATTLANAVSAIATGEATELP